MKKRKYQQTRRAKQSGETRQQILAAAMELHESLGPAHTTIKAVAEEAGVQRLTVYRHFADEASLFQACTTHWLDLHPLPESEEWAGIEAPEERISRAMYLFFRYYRKTERMWHVTYRDLDGVAALAEPVAAVEKYIDKSADDLLSGLQLTGNEKKMLSITVRHGLRFSTWQSLKNEKLTDKKILELVMRWVNLAGK